MDDQGTPGEATTYVPLDDQGHQGRPVDRDGHLRIQGSDLAASSPGDSRSASHATLHGSYEGKYVRSIEREQDYLHASTGVASRARSASRGNQPAVH